MARKARVVDRDVHAQSAIWLEASSMRFAARPPVNKTIPDASIDRVCEQQGAGASV
jgi:hypothetical protein